MQFQLEQKIKKLVLLSMLLAFMGNVYAADDQHDEHKDAEHKEAADHKTDGDHKEGEHKEEHKEEAKH